MMNFGHLKNGVPVSIDSVGFHLKFDSRPSGFLGSLDTERKDPRDRLRPRWFMRLGMNQFTYDIPGLVNIQKTMENHHL